MTELIGTGPWQEASFPHVVQFAERFLWELMLSEEHDKLFTQHPGSKSSPCGGVPRLICPGFRVGKIRWRVISHMSGESSEIGGREIVFEQDKDHLLGFNILCKYEYFVVRWVRMHLLPEIDANWPIYFRSDFVTPA